MKTKLHVFNLLNLKQMKTKLFLGLIFVIALAFGNSSKIKADMDPVKNIRNMASCGEGCVCCLNNTSTYCGAAACSTLP